MTKQNLEAAFAGESQAHMKYMAFAEKAEADGRSNVARIFRAASFSEQMHATNHLRQLNGINDTADNLAGAHCGETCEIDDMYPSFIAVAELQKEKGAQTSFDRALQAEKVHQGLYQRAKNAVGQGNDIDLEKVVVCGVCGFTAEGDAPDKCPLCGAPKEKFKDF